jgi:hypothetical protein
MERIRGVGALCRRNQTGVMCNYPVQLWLLLPNLDGKVPLCTYGLVGPYIHPPPRLKTAVRKIFAFPV